MKIIAHLDMDAFFASVEEQVHPWRKGKPIVVGTPPDEGRARGVVSTANYKARAYGIHSAMPISKAWQISEQARKEGKEPVTFLPVNFARYKKVSENVLGILTSYLINLKSGVAVEQSSVDEFYFDLSEAGSFAAAKKICAQIKKDIFEAHSITCSIGLGPNRFIAKIAAGFKKPDGLFIVRQPEVQAFLDPLAIREIPGIGPKTAEIFYKKGIQTVKELRALTQEELQKLAGKHGLAIYHMARGIGNAEIATEHEIKSIGQQTTFPADSLEAGYILAEFKTLSNHVFKSFTQTDFTGFKTIAVIIRFSDFKTQTTSHTLQEPITKTQKKKFEIESLKILLPFLDKRQNPQQKRIRLVGIRIEKFK